MSLYKYPSSSRQATSPPTGLTEFEILKTSHKFLREDDEKPSESTWDEQLAGKYYSSLYREFAVCDLKHYKSGNFSLRWRTEEEVLDGSGESTCGNTRCAHHFPARFARDKPGLATLELPFAYMEHGESKSALVKVVLCGRCTKKLMWKHAKEKELRQRQGENSVTGDSQPHLEKGEEKEKESASIQAADILEDERRERHRRKKHPREEAEEEEERPSRRKRSSRSKSPRRSSNEDKNTKERSSHSRKHAT